MNPRALEGYLRVLASDGVESWVSRCLEGDLGPPLIELEAPPETIGYPPALIPIWSEGSGPWYYGYWRHWFVSRMPTFVMYDLEANVVCEIGRSAFQLVGGLALRDIEAEDGMTENLRSFMMSIGFPDLQHFELLSEGGDDPSVLISHLAFRDRLPLSVPGEVGGYRGDFPNPLDFSTWSSASTIELDRQAIAESGDPPWLRTRDPRAAFENSLKTGQLGVAWLALNCRNWSYRAASEAIMKLAFHADSSEFSILAESYVAEVGLLNGGY